MIAIEASSRRPLLWIGGAALVVTAVAALGPRREAPTPRVVEAPPELVPLSGDAWRDLGEARCLAFLASWLERPGWTLRLRRGTAGCTADVVHDGLAIDAAGRASWIDGRGRERSIVLPERALAELVAAAAESCDRPPEAPFGYTSHWLDVSWSGRGAPDVHVGESPALDRLYRLLDDVEAEYRARRLASRRTTELRAVIPAGAAPMYHPRALLLTVTGERVAIRDRRRLVQVRLDEPTALAAVDWIELDGGAPALLPWELGVELRQGLE